MTSKKNKVVWLCHFSNEQLQELVKPRKKVGEYAPWIKSLIHLFENDDTIELHIVAQHEYLMFSKHFQHKGINFHIVRKGIPLLGRHWPRFFKWDRWTDQAFWKKKSKKIIDKIKPDIIHMHGFENEFCNAIFQFKDRFPVFITIQGFIHQSKDESTITQKRKQNELAIIDQFKHFAVRTKTMKKDLLSLNPNASTHWHQYPLNIPSAKNTAKKYDVVFFARLTKDKGIEDLLRALQIVTQKYNPSIKVCIIGGGNISFYTSMANELGINHNLDWKGFLPTQQDVYNTVVQAKTTVLPTYHDIVSGTIIESLFLKVPVVAYNTGSIHEVNEHEQIIELVDKFDIDGLAKAINELSASEDLIKLRAEKGYHRVNEMFGHSDTEIRNEILTIYDKVVSEESTKNGR